MPLALYVMLEPDLLKDKLHGETASSRLLCCAAAGYFVRDVVDTLVNI